MLSQPVHAQIALSQEEKLSAIRQGLLQAAMDGPTKVQSMVWIDSQGALQESSSFRTGMQVRGVQVVAYDRNSLGHPVADLQWQAQGGSSQTPELQSANSRPCAANPSGHLRHVVGLVISAASQWKSDELPVIRAMEGYVYRQWQGASGSAVTWRQSHSAVNTRAAYGSALTGSSADQMPWQARLSMRPSTVNTAPSFSFRDLVADEVMILTPSPEATVQLDFSVAERNQNEPLFEAQAQVKWRIDRPNWEPPRLSEESLTLLSQQLQSWMHTVNQRLSCVPVVPEIISGSREVVRINAGTLAGVRVGDEWLLASGRDYLHRILEPGVITQSVLAKVQTVADHHAQLQLIAGPQTSVQHGWRAWSTEDLR